MRKLILYVLIALSFASFAQNSVKQADGNYQQIKKNKSNYKPEGAFYTDKNGFKYTVYRSDKGKLFIFKVSKNTGKEYRYYLKF